MGKKRDLVKQVTVAKVVDVSDVAAPVVQESTTPVAINTTNLTPAQMQKVNDIRQAGGVAEAVKCIYCGKILVREQSMGRGSGDLCEHLREIGYTTEALMAHRATMSAPTAPEGWITVASLHKICEANGIPVNRMVNAIGRDRGLGEPIDPRFRPLYVGNKRFLNPWCASPEGLAMIRGGKLTKSEKITAELAELENAVK